MKPLSSCRQSTRPSRYTHSCLPVIAATPTAGKRTSNCRSLQAVQQQVLTLIPCSHCRQSTSTGTHTPTWCFYVLNIFFCFSCGKISKYINQNIKKTFDHFQAEIEKVKSEKALISQILKNTQGGQKYLPNVNISNFIVIFCLLHDISAVI